MKNKVYRGYIGTNSLRNSKGIYQIEVSDEKISILSTTQAVNSDYLAITEDEKYLYACMEVIYYQGKAVAAASAYRIEEDGRLTFINTQPIGGQLNCFIYVDKQGKNLYSASYMSGNISVNPINEDGSLAPVSKVITHEKQTGKHHPSIHSVYVTPDDKYLLATDVGLDLIFLYELQSGNYNCVCQVAAEGRPRQAAFSPDGKFVYVSTESGGEVYVFAYEPDEEIKLREIQRIRTTPEWFKGPHAETAGIKISPNGELLYVTNRYPEINDLGGFSVDKETGVLTPVERVKIPGVFPRDFSFTPDGAYALIGMQFSDEVGLYKVDYAGKRMDYIEKIKLPCCNCIKFLR